MKITRKLLESSAQQEPKTCTALKLSSFNIVIIEELEDYEELLYLDLSDNLIQFVCNLYPCRNLWHLDLSCNKVCHLEGLECFVALGTLDLSGNDLDWKELEKIQHLIIVDLRLTGNPDLEKDVYYRQHVIDSLPKIWMLDGLFITESERLQVDQFFNKSALTAHPVRRKLKPYRDSKPFGENLKNRVFGTKATEFLLSWSQNGQRNYESDVKRMEYISTFLYERAVVKEEFNSEKCKNENMMKEIFEARMNNNVESHFCNMLLILYFVCLKFSLPLKLLESSLDCLEITNIGMITGNRLLDSTEDEKLAIICLLLNCEKLERDNSVTNPGELYHELYISLCLSLPSLLSPLSHHRYKHHSDRIKLTSELVTSDVMQIFCNLPDFFEILRKHSEVRQALVSSTGDRSILTKISDMSNKLPSGEDPKVKEMERLSEEIGNLCRARFLSLSSYVSRTLEEREKFLLTVHEALPRHSKSRILASSEYHARGLSYPRKQQQLIKSRQTRIGNKNTKTPELDDEILLAPQVFSRIMSIPDPNKWLVQLYSLPDEFNATTGPSQFNFKSNSSNRLLYLNPRSLEWDAKAHYWKPIATQGDRVTLRHVVRQNAEDFKTEVTPSLLPLLIPPKHQKQVNPFNPRI